MPQHRNLRSIFVLGSANMDLVFALDRLPLAGETRTGGDLSLFPGGKGANQACAAARLGGRAAMVARVGADAFGSRLVESLAAAGVDVSRMRACGRATGCACIYVLPNGENSIVISPGANAALDPAGAIADLSAIQPGDLLLAQLETPLETVQAAFAHARSRGAVTILDPAPVRELPRELLESVDYLTPNQTEAAFLIDKDEVAAHNAEAAAERVAALGPRAVILKLGEHGSLFWEPGRTLSIPAYRVEAVDTTAAGDVFNGAFAVALAEDLPVEAALEFATAAAAISVTRHGAQPSVPDRTEVDTMQRSSHVRSR
jgi:ribokinase